MRKRRIEITTETYEVLVIRQSENTNHFWCVSCDKQVAAVSLSDICGSGLGAEVIYRQIEKGRFHLIKTVEGTSFICLNSLINNEKETV